MSPTTQGKPAWWTFIVPKKPSTTTTLPCPSGAMQVEKDERLFEAFRQLVPWLRIVDRAAGVGDELPFLVVNRHDHAARH